MRIRRIRQRASSLNKVAWSEAALGARGHRRRRFDRMAGHPHAAIARRPALRTSSLDVGSAGKVAVLEEANALCSTAVLDVVVSGKRVGASAGDEADGQAKQTDDATRHSRA